MPHLQNKLHCLLQGKVTTAQKKTILQTSCIRPKSIVKPDLPINISITNQKEIAVVLI
jgi:hypothetical protein